LALLAFAFSIIEVNDEICARQLQAVGYEALEETSL
jgi:hypothetical protein